MLISCVALRLHTPMLASCPPVILSLVTLHHAQPLHLRDGHQIENIGHRCRGCLHQGNPLDLGIHLLSLLIHLSSQAALVYDQSYPYSFTVIFTLSTSYYVE
jgi:hypothetical protein